MTRITLLVSVMALVGCAAKPFVFNKPGASRTEFAQDRYQCMQETAGAGNYSAFGPPIFVAAAAGAARKRQRNMMVACMEARGYVLEQH